MEKNISDIPLLVKKGREDGKKIEVELRFQDINEKIFNRIRKNYSKTDSIISNTIDFIYPNEVRKTISETEEPIYIIKKSIYTNIISDYNVKFSVSEEVSVPQANITSEYKMKRTKNRISYLLYESRVRLDTTIVISESNGINNVRYEIEAEFLDEFDQNFINTVTVSIMKIIQDTEHVYTKETKNKVIRNFNQSLGSNKLNELDHTKLTQARNLKKWDCVYGGLIGGAIEYSITYKAKGLRKQLFIDDETGIWLVYPPLELNLIAPINKLHSLVRNFLGNFSGTILDGENILEENRNKDVKYEAKRNLYYCFDLIEYKDKSNLKSIKKNDHFERLKFIDFLLEKNLSELGNLSLRKKDFFPIKTVEELNSNLIRLEEEKHLLPYQIDGYIFTPINHGYFIPPSDKSLKEEPSICKWKPFNELTIDFYYNLNNLSASPIQLMVGRRGTLVEFKGDIFPFSSSENVDLSSLPQGLSIGTIIEMGPKGNQPILEFKLIRTDKQNPNGEFTANSVWNDINNPLTLETLEGKSFDLLFQYHNREKKKLLDSITDNSIIIDIGSGRGGVLNKMSRAQKILCIEPNSEHIKELLRRVEQNKKLEGKVEVLQCGGEDTAIILGKLPEIFEKHRNSKLYVTMFLSLSFFFKNDEMLGKLINTLRGIAEIYKRYTPSQEVIFLCTTINEKNLKKELHKGNFNIGLAEFKFTPPNIIFINIPGSIVENQEEYLVDINKFITTLKLKNPEIQEHNQEKFLSRDEKKFSSLYVSLRGIITSELSTITPKNYGKYAENKYFIEVQSGDIISLISIIYQGQVTKQQLKDMYVFWLKSEDPKYTEEAALQKFFNGVDTRTNKEYKLNSNYYTVMDGGFYKYMQQHFDKNNEGITYYLKFFSTDTILPYYVMYPIAYYLNKIIRIYNFDRALKEVAILGDKGENILILEESGTYKLLGIYDLQTKQTQLYI